jgi:hypothetical protein
LVVSGNFQYYKFLENWIKIPCLVDGKSFKVERRPYEWWKNICAKRSWNEREMDGQSWASNLTLEIIKIHLFFGRKTLQLFETIFNIYYVLGTLYKFTLLSYSFILQHGQIINFKNIKLLNVAPTWKKIANMV